MKWHMAREFVEYLLEGGTKIVVLQYKGAIVPGGKLNRPLPKAFKYFAKLMNREGLTLYIDSPDFKCLRKKFSKAKIRVKFYQ